MRTRKEIEEKLKEIEKKTRELEEERPYLSEEDHVLNMRDRWWLDDERRLILWILGEYEFVDGF